MSFSFPSSPQAGNLIRVDMRTKITLALVVLLLTVACFTPRTEDTGIRQVPPVRQEAAAVGFVDILTVVPDAVIDLRYTTPNNFVGEQLYPSDARCLIHRAMASGIAAAAETLRAQGYTLVFWDCYRPHSVQVRMFEAVSDPAWVAEPGPYSKSHEAGRAVDVTLADARTQCPRERRVGSLCLMDMGTDFDDFSATAAAYATDGVSPEARANRSRLRKAMEDGGFTIYSGEWWHFNGPDSHVKRPIIDVPVN